MSGLSAITGISYGTAILFKSFVKFLKFINIFKGKKQNTANLLDKIWAKTPTRRGRSFLNYALAIFVAVVYAAVHIFIRRKRQQIQIQVEEEKIAEEQKLETLDEYWNKEASLEDFEANREFSTIDEDNQEDTNFFSLSSDSETEPVELKKKGFGKHAPAWASKYNKYSEEGWPMTQY